jgi:hypothetical protein
MEELPAFRWSVKLTPLMDRSEQLRRYTEATSLEAAKRQVHLAREELPKRKRRAN